MKKILVFLISCYVALASTVVNASVGGWTLSNATPVGATTIYDGVKQIGDIIKRSTASITPNATQVAKVLARGGAGYALSVAVEELLGAVDWVMDPANNQIKYKIPSAITDPRDPINQFYYKIGGKDFSTFGAACTYWLGYAYPEVSETKKKNTGTVCQVNTTGSWANIPISTYSNPAYDPNAESKDEEKSIPLETVAAKVISNAEANDTNAQVATIAAASDIVSEAETDPEVAAPIINQLEANATGGDPNDPDDEKPVNDGKQSKKMNEKQIGELVGNPKWHKIGLKEKIVKAYSKQLKGSKNFDFYKDPKTGEIFIKGNKSNDMILINLERFL